jgi:polygalacturonase
MGEVNVKEHGATGNGTTDDAPAVRNAINEALSSGINAVFFPPGIYITQVAPYRVPSSTV